MGNEKWRAFLSKDSPQAVFTYRGYTYYRGHETDLPKMPEEYMEWLRKHPHITLEPFDKEEEPIEEPKPEIDTTTAVSNESATITIPEPETEIPWTIEDLDTMSYKELQAKAKELELRTVGTKDILKKRIKNEMNRKED